jgi:CDP-diacylglycerol---glycerol-3-phosphate 3-phosphatidyltransferase
MRRHIPNLITLARLLLTVCFFILLTVHDENTFIWHMQIGFVVFIVAVLTDILDGYLARHWKVESAFGRVVDPFVDKVLICGAFIFFSSDDFINTAILKEYPGAALTTTLTATGVHPWMAVVIIAREFLVTSIRGLAESRGIDFRADWAGKIKMFIQSFAVGAILIDLALLNRTPWVHHVRDIAIWTTVIVTLLSATTYILRARKVLAE